MAINVLVENNAAGQLASGISDSATSLSVKSGEGAEFPNPTGSQYFYCTLQKASGDWEIIKVTARSSDTFTTIVRNIASSTGSAQSFLADDIVSLRPVAEIIEDIIAAHNGLGTMADQENDSVNIDGGTINDVTIVPADHGVATNPEVVAIVYGTGSPPAANSTPIGSLFVKYAA